MVFYQVFLFGGKMFRRYFKFWREALDFHSGAYRLDFFWIHVVNDLILAIIGFVTLTVSNSFWLVLKVDAAVLIVLFIPSLSLFIRRLRDTGFSINQVMFVLLSPSLLWIAIEISIELRSAMLVLLVILIYFGWLVFLVSRRSAYWTPLLSRIEKIYYGIGFAIMVSLSIGLQLSAGSVVRQNVKKALVHAVFKQQKVEKNTVRTTESDTSSSSELSSSAERIPSSVSSKIPDKSVVAVPDDSATKVYRQLPVDVIGDSDFGHFQVKGNWQQDASSLQWLQQTQQVMILTSTLGQGWGVDFSSFSFQKVVGQSQLTLSNFPAINVLRIDGTYESPNSDKVKNMAYLEWHMSDGHIRVIYVIAPSQALLNLIVATIGETYQSQ